MNLLRERYITAVLEHVSEGQKEEVGTEVRSAIDEMVDQRVEAGEPERMATDWALNELGDPVKLALSYQDRPRYLIGPGWYPSYISLLKRIPAIVLPIVAAITLLVAIGIDGKSLFDAIGGTVESVLFAGLQIVFWVTLGFAIAERVVGPEMPVNKDKPWTIADLPEAPAKRQITLGGVLPDIIAMLVFGALALVQYTEGVGYFIRGGAESVKDLAFVNPDLAWGWKTGFFALVAFSIASAVVRYLRGYWTRPVTLLEIADSALWVVYIVALAMSPPIINPEFAERVDEGSRWWTRGGQASTVIAAAIVLISVQTAWEAWSGHREYQRMGAGRA